MVIDIHTHTFPDKIAASALDKIKHMAHAQPFTDGTSSGLQASMAEAGIDRSVVLPVATNATQVPKVNTASATVNETTEQTGIFSFGCMHPEYPDWKDELGRVAELGLKGIKIHPLYQGVQIDDPRYLRIFERCGELGLTVVTHAGNDIGFPGGVLCSPSMCRNALRQVGPVKLILAHMGGWKNWDEVGEMLSDTSACLDTSFALGEISPLDDHFRTKEDPKLMSDELFVSIVRQFGAQRVYFGTDSPWGGQKETMDLFRALPLTEEEKRMILEDNAQNLLGWNG